MEHPSIKAGSELMHEFGDRIYGAAVDAEQPFLFFAGLVGGLAGQMAQTIGKDAALVVLEQTAKMVAIVINEAPAVN